MAGLVQAGFPAKYLIKAMCKTGARKIENAHVEEHPCAFQCTRDWLEVKEKEQQN